MRGARFWLTACVSCNLLLAHEPGKKGDAGVEASVDAGIDASITSPISIPDVFIWLDGDLVNVNETTVINWPDQTGRGNTAVAHPDETKKIGSPVWQAANLAGHGGIKFACDSYLAIDDVEDVRMGTSDYTIAFVLRYLNKPPYHSEYGGYGCLWMKPDPYWPHYGINIGANTPGPLYDLDGGYRPEQDGVFYSAIKSSADGENGVVFSLQTGVNDDTPHVVITDRRKKTSLGMRVDGVAMRNDKVTVTDIDNTGIRVEIGGRANVFGGDGVTQCLRGTIYEIVGIHRSIRDDEAIALESYFKQRYALSF